MRYVALFALAGLASFANARAFAAGRQDAVFEVRSGACDGSKALQGSGIWLRIDGADYVLTSESVTDGAPAACHWVQGAGAPAARAQLVAADWAWGLALLKLGTPPTAGAPLGLDDLLTQAPRPGTHALSAGYSLAGAPLADAQGSVLIGRSDRHELVEVAWATELDGARIEAGMVGGASFDPQGKLLGLISHEYLKMQEGSATRPRQWDRVPGHYEPKIVLIPAALVSQWLKAYLADPSRFAPAAFVADEDRLGGVDRVHVQGLVLQSFCPTPQPSGGSGSAPVGGGDGTGIGGGDGTGIGGDSPQDPACRIVFTRETGAIAQGPALPGIAATWATVSRRLAAGKQAKLLYFTQRDAFSGGLSAQVVRSVAGMLSTMVRGGWTPTVVYDAPLGAPAGSPLEHAQATVDEIMKQLDFYAFADCSLHAGTLLIQGVLRSDEPGLAQPGDIDWLKDRSGEYHDCWYWIELADQHRPADANPPKLVPYLQDKYTELKSALSQMAGAGR